MVDLCFPTNANQEVPINAQVSQLFLEDNPARTGCRGTFVNPCDNSRLIRRDTCDKGDPDFVIAEKVEDVVGLYMDPPCHAVVLSIDEKSQIQALDRMQPGLPLKPGKCATMTHDYKRNGTTTLFAALNVLDGTVLGRCMKRHRHQEFIKFLNAVERKVPAGKIIHVILDNYGAHKHPKVERWLADHPRWVFHFTPTSASWLNAVENFSSAITRRRIRRGVFEFGDGLEDAIKRYIAGHNRHAQPFVWTKTADVIFQKLNRLDLNLLNEPVH